ncbi:abc transporter [Diplodia corticola]|uniref:Abc transporter n=1 Tax=Diplodia corticola TaxID=236234 RepID=A0A1J9RQM3_9PEZI|nr:abc transporter [Diplodia corticola]OJD29853.1 abc transporter [Diplodia corticola]
MSITTVSKPTPPPRPSRPDANQTPLTPTSPRLPGGWPTTHTFPLPHPPHPKSPPPSPPVSAGLSESLPFAMTRMLLESGVVEAAAVRGGDPPNSPATPGTWRSGGKWRGATGEQQQKKRTRYWRGRSKRASVSSSENSLEDGPYVGRPRALTQPTQLGMSYQQRPLPRVCERRCSSPTGPRRPRVTETQGWSSSSDSEASDDDVSTYNPPRRTLRVRRGSDTRPATVLRLEGVGAVVIEEAPRRAISAKAGGGVRLVDARSPGEWSTPVIVKDGEMNVVEAEAVEFQQEATLGEPGPGLSGNERVMKTLRSKRMEALRTGRLSPGGALDFEERPLPSTPMSMQPTPRELYPASDGSVSTSPSLSSSPALTPPATTSLPLRFPMPPSHIPGRPPLQPLPETPDIVDDNTTDDMGASAYPLTPIATDLSSLSVIAGLGDDSPSAHRKTRSDSRPSRSSNSSRAGTYDDASRSSSVSTTSIRLRSGSVVTVIPPEQTAWQRTAYVAGPIRLNNFSNLASSSDASLPGLSRKRGKAGSVASLDAFQDAIESLLENPATQGRRASDENALEELVEYFEDFGFSPAGGEGESLDCYWSSELNGDAKSRGNHGSFGTGWLSPPPEKPVPVVPVHFPTEYSLTAKRMRAMNGSMGAVEVIEMQDGDSGSLKRTPSLLSRASRTSGERRSRLAGPSGQKTKLRRLMMSAGGIL